MLGEDKPFQPEPAREIKPDVEPPAQQPRRGSGLAKYAPPDTEGLSVARIRWMSAFNKIITQWNEVSHVITVGCAISAMRLRHSCSFQY